MSKAVSRMLSIVAVGIVLASGCSSSTRFVKVTTRPEGKGATLYVNGELKGNVKALKEVALDFNQYERICIQLVMKGYQPVIQYYSSPEEIPEGLAEFALTEDIR